MSRKDDMNNHANQMNPNNDLYWTARGYDERPLTGGSVNRGGRKQGPASQVPHVQEVDRHKMVSGISGIVSTLSTGTVMNDMDNNNQHPLAGLYSGEILRYVVQALDIKDDVLDSRTARRFFAGEPKNEYNRGSNLRSTGAGTDPTRHRPRIPRCPAERGIRGNGDRNGGGLGWVSVGTT